MYGTYVIDVWTIHALYLQTTTLKNNSFLLDVQKGEYRSLCTCPDPLNATPPPNPHPQWGAVHEAHSKLAAASFSQYVDVVFLGDSITEGWNETFWGLDASDTLGPAKTVFAKYFTRRQYTYYDVLPYIGLPLGIAGDSVRHSFFLVRLQGR